MLYVGSEQCAAKIAVEDVRAFRGILLFLRNPDPEKERSERKLSLNAFLATYNEGLPEQFTPASVELLKKFQKESPKLFQDGSSWTLDKHRKQFMDWARAHARSLQLIADARS